jgi:hypothetical protein
VIRAILPGKKNRKRGIAESKAYTVCREINAMLSLDRFGFAAVVTYDHTLGWTVVVAPVTPFPKDD